MPLKKKNKLRNRIIFWTLALILLGLMIYVPKRHAPIGGDEVFEYELY